MSSIITVRNIDSGDKSWLQQEAKDQGVSMEEIVRRLIREKRQKAQSREKPSEVFRRYIWEVFLFSFSGMPSRVVFNNYRCGCP